MGDPAGPLTAVAILVVTALSFLVDSVSRTGGHLGPNLGVVELTIALHRVFDSPNDPFVFDTGHQSYVHKLLTGRQDFSGLRSRGGLAGYPQRSESVHDVVESSHASSSLSWADGISRAFALTGQNDRTTVVVVGDGPDDLLVVFRHVGGTFEPTSVVGDDGTIDANSALFQVLEQLGFRKVVDASFMIAFMFPLNVDEGDVEKYMNGMKRAQMELDFAPEKYRHYYRNEIPDRYRDKVDTRRFSTGERIVFLPYTQEMYEKTQAWIHERGIFEGQPPVPDYAASVAA